tara:strand:+ start:610 stop:792 length:183 start_codon:yes stop_codon:yes gene_type:complete
MTTSRLQITPSGAIKLRLRSVADNFTTRAVQDARATRMLNDDVIQVYIRIKVNTPVVVIN